VVAVSVERMEGEGYVLQSVGRFAHAEEYLSRTALQAGLSELEREACELRLERGLPVPGLVGVYRKKASRTAVSRAC
jgi:predicted TPR repeat methyltransferase